MRERIPQGGTTRVTFDAYLASDHLSPATGKTIVITLSKNGAAYANPAGGATAAVEIGGGSYYVDVPAADKDTLGPLIVRGTEGSIDPVKLHYDVVADIEALLALSTAIAGYCDTEIAAIKAKTDNLPPDPADASDIAALLSALTTLVSSTGVALTSAERNTLTAATLAAFQAHSDWQKLLANVEGAFAFTPPSSYPGTGTLVLKNKANNTTLATITLTFNASQVITGRSVV